MQPQGPIPVVAPPPPVTAAEDIPAFAFVKANGDGTASVAAVGDAAYGVSRQPIRRGEVASTDVPSGNVSGPGSRFVSVRAGASIPPHWPVRPGPAGVAVPVYSEADPVAGNAGPDGGRPGDLVLVHVSPYIPPPRPEPGEES